MNRFALFSILLGASLLPADTLTLLNGNTYEGNFMGGDGRTIRFGVGNQVNTYNLNQVDSIRFSGSQSYQAPPPPPPRTSSQDYSAPGNAPSSYGPAGVEVPAGTEVVVRLIDGADSEKDSLGQTYRASVDQAVVVNGQTVIPRGSDVTATLIDAQKSGKIRGKASLTLDLKTVIINNRTYDIVTTGISQASGSRGARSAKVIGGTAALGAIIGGIAGGGSGAAIGAGSGAAVGTAAEVMTSGQKVKIPSETRLTFTLQNPLAL